jgi:hypothetical protein
MAVNAKKRLSCGQWATYANALLPSTRFSAFPVQFWLRGSLVWRFPNKFFFVFSNLPLQVDQGHSELITAGQDCEDGDGPTTQRVCTE